ncbi:3'(2'),5'-bisphosphate nucleotidase [Sinorhizobium meliloti]|nr:3'(2'),5'-bisphosphate nucleotidase [Sinorhizobium meliloti]
MVQAVFKAGKSLARDFGEVQNLQVSLKGPADYVSQADRKAERIIREELMKARPTYGFLGEEGEEIKGTDGAHRWIVDPLDGTKEFINRRNDFTVNIALIEGNVPVAGIVYAPAQRCAYVADGGRAEKLLLDPAWALEHRQSIRVRMRGVELTAVASRSHNSSETEAFLNGHGVMNYASVGSSLKFCLLAEGKADVYPRFGRTMEWDTAAGDAVLKAAGGSVVRLDGSRLLYGKTVQEEDSAFANPHFIAWADMSSLHLSGAEGLQPAYALS